MFRNIGLMQKLMLLFVSMLITSFVVMFIVNMKSFEEEAYSQLKEKARAITIEAENARVYMGDLRGKYNSFDETRLLDELNKVMEGRTFASVEDRLETIRSTSYYWTIPIVAGWTVGQTNAGKANYIIPRSQGAGQKSEERAQHH